MSSGYAGNHCKILSNSLRTSIIKCFKFLKITSWNPFHFKIHPVKKEESASSPKDFNYPLAWSFQIFIKIIQILKTK